MKDKQIINILMNVIWDLSDGGEVAVSFMVNDGIPVNVIAEYYGKSKTAEYLQKAKELDMLD